VYLNTAFIVIGSGPAGQKGAVAAAKAHNRVAVIDDLAYPNSPSI